MRKYFWLLIFFAFIAIAESNSDGEPDLNAIFGNDNQKSVSAPSNDSDEPDLGSIFEEENNEDEANSGSPDLDSIFGSDESSNEPEPLDIFDKNTEEEGMESELPWYVVSMDSQPSNVLNRIFYYMDYGPQYVQHYLTKGPNTLLEYVEAETGIPFQAKKYPLEISGFVEGRGGIRTQNPKNQKFASIGELRAQIEAHKTFEWNIFDKIKYVSWKTTTFNFKGDVYGDFVTTDVGFDLREANVEFSPFDFADVKIGRQILTWGTGDLLFINDLFPKDWQSFFIGRDVEYLKAPSDALKLSIFNKIVNVDAVWVPVFNPDRFISGQRISYWNPMLNERVGRDYQISTDQPNSWFSDSEWHARAYRNIKVFDNNYQVAAYFYNGYWKSPAGFNPQNGNMTFPRLNVYGGSVRGPVWKGIANMEFGYYDSYDDRSGKDPFAENSQIRWLIGYELNMEQFVGRTIGQDLTLGAQYYAEWMMDYGRYKNNNPSGIDLKDEYRQVVTLRATKLLLDQNLELSFFAYFSPDDVDAYLRPHISYKITDYWTADLGANVFIGKEAHTFFDQFVRDSNIYIGLRCSF